MKTILFLSLIKTTLVVTIMIPVLCSCNSPAKSYKKETKAYKSAHSQTNGTISKQDIAHLPEPLIHYFEHCNYVGSAKATYAEVIFEDSKIKLQPEKKWMKLKTQQYNFVTEPARIAYMKATMMGFIPFEGRDKYSEGQGHMLGVLGKLIKVFDEKEHEIAKGAALVLLAEALLIPSYALQDYISWEAVDSLTAKARFVHKGVDVGGTFHFNEKREYIRFTTNERPYSKSDGRFLYPPYTVEIRSYQKQGDILIAKEVAAIWNLPDGDFEYWSGTIKKIK